MRTLAVLPRPAPDTRVRRLGTFRTLLGTVNHPAPIAAPATPGASPGTLTAAPTTSEGHLAIAARLVETGWLATLDFTGRHELHHAAVPPAALAALLERSILGDGEEAAAGMRASCGIDLPLAAVPGALDARLTPRCGGCGDALGYPDGVGAPGQDQGCAERLETRLETLR